MKTIQTSAITPFIPSFLLEVYGLPVWYWLSIFGTLLMAFLLATLLGRPLSLLIAHVVRQRSRVDKNLFVEKFAGPIRAIIALIFFLVMNAFIKEPETVDTTMPVAKSLAVFLIVTYLLYRLIDFGFARLARNYQSPRSQISLVMPLGRRVCKTVLVICATLAVLAHIGIDVSALLVGLGVGGLAIALAAQKILENLFGGVVLSLDQPFQVGDFCKCGDILGYVEEIGIRSTRIRTVDRTLVSIPNFKLSELHIENHMEREKIRLYVIVRLDLETPLNSIKEFLSECERHMLENDNFFHEIYRVRLLGASERGFEIELYTFARTTAWSEFVGMRENYLFRVFESMRKLNIKFAVPVVKNPG